MTTFEESSLIASIASHISWANTVDRSARTANARAALDAKFLRLADGDPVRAEHLRKAHYKGLALKSARARRRAQEFARDAAEADAELDGLGLADVDQLDSLGGEHDSVAS